MGDGHNNIIGKFQTAQSQFYCKGVIPLWLDGYGEINEDFDTVLQQLVQEVAAGHDGLTISPLVNTDKKSGAYQIMLQQSRQAIAVTAANRHDSHILGQLHYVCATAKEAYDTCRSQHSDNRWTPNQQGWSSWFNAHTSEGYLMFEQFRNGYYYHMPQCSDKISVCKYLRWVLLMKIWTKVIILY